MSIDKSINDMKDYLKEWIDLGRCPDEFMGQKMTNLNLEDEKSVIHKLGTRLYSAITEEKYQGELNHKKIKKPRLYQFLKMVLKEDKNEIESNPDFLLSVLEKEIRDLIKDEEITDEYKIDYLSTVGLTRLRNQDYVGHYQFDNALVMIVADGVGGAEGGEIASKITIEFILKSLKEYDDLSQEENIEETLREIVFKSNQNVLDYAKTHDIKSMGTTLSLALVVNSDTLYIAHVGDSRIYEYNRGKIPRQITPDHSEIEILIREGKVQEEDRKKYKKNILRYAIGIESLKKENIFIQNSVIRGDTALLLCSDGLWEKIDVNEETFTNDINHLEDDIYAVVPTDNVTVLRYFAVAQELDIDDFEEIEEEEFSENESKVIADTKKNKLKTEQKKRKEKKSKKDLPLVENIKNNESLRNSLLFITMIIVAFLGMFIGSSIFNKNDIKSEGNETKKSQDIMFFESVKAKDINKTEQLLKNIDINKTDENNHTALYYSYKNMDVNTSLFLIEQGIDAKSIKKEILKDIKEKEKELNALKDFKKRLKI